MYERLPLDFIGVTDNFGARVDPITKVSSYHYGVDLGWNKYEGEKVYAIYDSTLVEEGYDKNLGNYTVFKYDKKNNTIIYRFLHLKNRTSIKVGEKVKQQTVVGYMGSTGYSTGTHLHFEYWICPKGYNYKFSDRGKYAVDPLKHCYLFDNQTANKSINLLTRVLGTSKKKENVQDAHEAIRPTDINKTPEKMKEYLTSDEYKLYKLIYIRTLASLMKDAKTLATTIILDNNDYKFKASGSVLTFDGYLKVYKDYEDKEDKNLPDLDKYNTSVLVSTKIESDEHYTKPKSRYTEAKLIKELEELGIGRPSTYVKIIDTLKLRDYVKVIDKKFVPTEIGIATTRKLQESFSNLINVTYTANMENDLDKIAEGKKVWYDLLNEFWKEFEPQVKEAFTSMEKVEAKKTGEKCPECGSDMVIRNGKFGEFEACSNYPTCKYIKKKEKEVKEIIPCPNCKGTIIEKKTKKGKIFYGCNNYPKCNFASWDKPLIEKCPECGGVLVEKKDKIKCLSCDYEK